MLDLNTASGALLKHIAGINATIAKNIVAYRNENGMFLNRRQLLKVPRLGPAAFTQCAGFLRIHAAKSPLDNTPVHPESYPLAEKILDRLGFWFGLDDLDDKDRSRTAGCQKQTPRHGKTGWGTGCRASLLSAIFLMPWSSQDAIRAKTCPRR